MDFMKRLVTLLACVLLAAGFSFESAAVDSFDVSAANEYAVSSELLETENAGQDDFDTPILLFTSSLRSFASDLLQNELGINTVHGQPLPGVLITLLLGAAFGLARKMRRAARQSSPDENHAADAFLLTARLLRMHILYSNPPETIHTISPGPDLFCLRE